MCSINDYRNLGFMIKGIEVFLCMIALWHLSYWLIEEAFYVYMMVFQTHLEMFWTFLRGSDISTSVYTTEIHVQHEYLEEEIVTIQRVVVPVIAQV